LLTSSRRGIVYPNTTRVDSADVPRDFLSMVNALEVDMIYGQGTLAARPTSTVGTPGIQGRMYMATDQTPHALYYDYGTGWDSIGSGTIFGTRASRPAAASANTGLFYWATDQLALYLSDGSAWQRQGIQAGDLCDALESSRSGYIIPVGQTWASAGGTTGPNADLFAKWGTAYPTNLPDLQGRHRVTLGTHTDVSVLGNNEGIAVGSRRPRHKHNVAANAVSNAASSGNVQAGGSVNAPGTTAACSSSNVGTPLPLSITTNVSTNVSATVGPQTGSEPVDSAAYLVVQTFAKL